MSTGLYDLNDALGLVGLSDQPSASTVRKIKSGQFQSTPGAQKDDSYKPDSPTFFQAPPDRTMMPERMRAKEAVNTTARSGAGGSIFFRRKNGFSAGGTLGVVDFDLILEEETTYRAQVCQHPVQSGDPITDHIQALPPTGRLKVLISNFSLRYAVGGAHAGQWDASQNRAMAAYEVLKNLMRSRSEVALVTTLEDFSAVNNQVVLVRLTTPKKADDGDSLTFELEYTQIYKVSKLKTVKLTVSAKPADMKTPENRQMAPEVSTGAQSGQDEEYSGGPHLSDGGP